MKALFLQPDAAQVLSDMELDPRVKDHALEVVEKGYTVVKGAIPPDQCADTIAAFQRFAEANDAIFSAHRDDKGHYPRIVNLHAAIPKLLRLFTENSVWLAVQDVLFGVPTSLYTSLFYQVGSQQPMHRDTPVFATRPEYMYLGTTVYLEAADDGNGCLEVMEGGHRMKELDRAAMAAERYGATSEIPDFDNEIWAEYQNTVVAQGRAAGLKVKRVYVEPGDSLIWHPQLPHGGTAIADPTRTRFSFVMHNTPEGVPVYYQSAFFNPDAKLSEVAPWSYKHVDGRAVVDHGHVTFGTGNDTYPLDAFSNPNSTT